LTDALVLEGGGTGSGLLLLELEEFVGFLLALGLELGNDIGLGPASLGGKVTEEAEFPVRLQSEHLEGLRNDNTLLVVIGERHTLKDLKATESGGTLGGLVGKHTSGDFPEHARGRFPVFSATAGVRVDAVVAISLKVQVVTEKGTRNVDSFAAYDDDALTINQLLSNNASKAAHHVTASINNNLLFEHA